ncbi:hypothetical protein NQ318_017682 [Aromia moschata]|uniref:Uncharacterized protein n=1 Tax=Aromia moschata TaxID=1265417 RepID=A0AAV8XYZ4_9CUCU|nr:hypothetical protein NQ318_017682 [Aromia moschata]
MCHKRNKLFCFICLEMGGNQSTWTQEGFPTNMLPSRLPWQSDSTDDEAVLLFSLCKKKKRKRLWIYDVNKKMKKYVIIRLSKNAYNL